MKILWAHSLILLQLINSPCEWVAACEVNTEDLSIVPFAFILQLRLKIRSTCLLSSPNILYLAMS